MQSELEARKNRLDALRPLAPESLEALERWLDVELTYTSNAIEGNTLTRQETALVLEKGITVRGKPLKDHLEAVDHLEAWAYVRQLAAGGAPVTEHDVRQIHALVLGRSQREEAGRYSQIQRQIAGSKVVLPSPAEIPPLMADFGRWLGASVPGPKSAFEAHYRLVSIHPFADGNGRTARLLMNLLLLRAGWPPVVIAPEHRPDYLDTLELRQTGGAAEPYLAFMHARLLESLERHLDVLERSTRSSAAPSAGDDDPI
jgi:Fic family protein